MDFKTIRFICGLKRVGIMKYIFININPWVEETNRKGDNKLERVMFYVIFEPLLLLFYLWGSLS